MSISATNASVLSGCASKYGARRSRSAAHSGLWRSYVELLRERGRRRLVADVDRRERVGPLGRVVLERQLARLLEEHVDHDPLRRRQDHRLDELLVLVAAAVAADELHPGARQRDVEDAGVGGVGQVEADDLAALRAERRFGLAADEQHVAEPPHRHVGRLGRG